MILLLGGIAWLCCTIRMTQDDKNSDLTFDSPLKGKNNCSKIIYFHPKRSSIFYDIWAMKYDS